jgi:density-regulated protein DRP1
LEDLFPPKLKDPPSSATRASEVHHPSHGRTHTQIHHHPTMADIDIVDITTPRSVLYCDACGMPPEYCSYGPDFETHCLPWLKAKHPQLYEKLHADHIIATAATAAADGLGDAVASASASAAPKPSKPWTTRERLTAFYTQYMPEKLEGIDEILIKYEGKEDKLFMALVKKYGPEPMDPFFADGSDDDDDDDDESSDEDDDVDDEEDEDNLNDQMEGLDMKDAKKSSSKSSNNKRRGASAKKVNKVDTRIIIQKISRNRKKAVTHVVGMETIPGMKLKEASKAFSKRFAGSSSVKEKEIIIQGDHSNDVAEMIISKFGVSEDAVYFDLDGEFVPYSG